jgi:hypothetical protein
MTDRDLALIQLDQTAIADTAGRRAAATQVSGYASLFQVFNHGSMPATVPNGFACHGVAVSGTETEGGAATLTADSSLTIVEVLGPHVPPVGANLVAKQVGGFWWATYGRSSGGDGPPPLVNLNGCSCSNIPGTLYIHVSGPCDVFFQDCTLVYQTVPSEFSRLNLGTSCFLGTTFFVDAETGLSFQYYFACDGVFFRLSRIYLPTSFSDAFEDSFIYSWSMGQVGNTCLPFLLSKGTIYQGGNSDCEVLINDIP